MRREGGREEWREGGGAGEGVREGGREEERILTEGNGING